jgi:hypothetical protein
MNEAYFSIRSLDRELAFVHAEPNYFTVELRDPAVTAQLRVYAFSPHIDGGLAGLFEKLGRCERPWSGVEGWASLEGEFSVEATCSVVGKVKFSISMVSHLKEWRLSTSLYSELGQLPAIASAASSFLRATAAG